MDVELTVSQFIDTCNQTLEYAYPSVVITGEVSSFKVNQNKWVFFDLKDEESSISCFMTLWDLRQPLEDGMKVKVLCSPKLTKWGKFSVTVKRIQPIGEGNIKKSFELLKKKLEKEGLFAPEKKRPLPKPISKIGVISSTQAAGYADFVKILNERWGGLEVQVCHTQVQGLIAADQIIRALNYLNERSEVDVIAIIRGGGSADDLSVFNDEALVRAIAASKIPVITGIGHEVDESLSDLAADVVASTPSNAAQMLTPDRVAMKRNLEDKIVGIRQKISSEIQLIENSIQNKNDELKRIILSKIELLENKLKSTRKILDSLNPEIILEKGYSIIRGDIDIGQNIEIETNSELIDAKVIAKRSKHGH
ncbi:MAG: exodeoxyribonuclease VII large subunit [Candidatus Saccharibacteria bacterium]|nr:exodeoxyribonuclease VII large subunit [Candidatus Saccharibacteria bacterium]